MKIKNRLFIIEGIPGSGKTTTATRLYDELTRQGVKAKLFTEGMLHPCDTAWQAYLTESELSAFKARCEEIRNSLAEPKSTAEELDALIEKQCRHENGRVWLAYTVLNFPDRQLWEAVGTVAPKEICDGRMPLAEFKELHLRRWREFAENALKDDFIYIFECVFLQNHVNELLAVYQMSADEIFVYMNELMDAVRALTPKIIYLSPLSIPTVVGRAAEERKAENGRPAWIDSVIEWVSGTNFGKSHSLTHKGGVITYFRKRTAIELDILPRLGVDYEIRERE